MGWILLVTWMIPGQPTTSYQASYGSEAACNAARYGVLGSATEIKKQILEEAQRTGLPQIAAVGNFPHVSAVCSFTDALALK